MSWNLKRWLAHPLFPLGLLGTALIVILYALVPYSLGYGQKAASVFYNLWVMWHTTPDWEHCQLVPAIALGILYWNFEREKGRDIEFKSLDFIIYAVLTVGFVVACFERLPLLAVPSLLGLIAHVFLGRDRCADVTITSDYRAGILLFLALLWYWIGYKIDVLQLSFLSLHFTIGAMIVWFFGWNFMRKIAFPYAFLFFAWPIPILDSLAFKLRIIMSELSYQFLKIIGIDVLRIGTAIISAPDFASGIAQGAKFSLDVADPCSGIRSLFALTMVAALFAYFTQKSLWKQLVIVVCAVPLAVAGNFVRILMLTFGTMFFGNEFAIGTLEHPSFYHMLSGYVVFIVALGGMVTLGWLLSDGWKVVLVLCGLKDKSFIKPVEKMGRSES
jgi:exosortase